MFNKRARPAPTPREIASRIPHCPACGGGHYVAETELKGKDMVLLGLHCGACDADILGAYRRATGDAA